MRLSPMVAVLAACVLTLTACGGDDSDDKSDKSDTSDKDSSPSDSSSEAGEGTIEFEDSERKLPPKNVCKALDAKEVGEILGDEVKRGPVVQSTCTFADLLPQSERSVGITYLQLSAVGGLEAFEAALGEGAEEVPDVGDKAIVVVTETPNGAQVSAAMATGNALIQLQVIPGVGVSAEDAKTVATNLLRLVDARV